MTKRLVISHAQCADGFCAAWLCHREWGDKNTTYRFAQYSDPIPWGDIDSDTEVLILDFSYRRNLLEQIYEKAGSLTVLDHHISAERALEGLPYCTFDSTKSGAQLTQEYLGVESNWVVDMTADRDLWAWQLEDSRQINAAIASYPRSFAVWNNMFRAGPERLLVEGKGILRYRQRVIDVLTEEGIVGWTIIGGEVVPCVNVADPFLVSDTVGALASIHKDHAPFAASFFVKKDNTVVYSLRARRTDVDVSVIAKKYGGGGHKGAAGFRQFEMLPLFEERMEAMAANGVADPDAPF